MIQLIAVPQLLLAVMQRVLTITAVMATPWASRAFTVGWLGAFPPTMPVLLARSSGGEDL